MTDAEITEALAREVMGWTPWLEERGEYTHLVWSKPGENPWDRVRHDRREAESRRYQFADLASIDRHRIVPHLDHFKPLTDANDTERVIEALTEFDYMRDPATVAFRDRNEGRTFWAWVEPHGVKRATAEAALKAKGAWKDD